MPLPSEVRPGFLDLLGASPAEAAPISPLARSIYYLANAGPSAIEGVAKTISGIAGEPVQWTDPADNLTPGKGYEKLIDVAGGLLPVAAEMTAGSGALRALGLAKVATKAPVLARTIEDALLFGGLGAQEDKTTGLEQAGEGAAYGALTKLPRLSRFPLAALLGAGSKAFFDRNGEDKVAGDFSRGDIAGMAGVITALLPGQMGKAAKAKAILPDNFATVAKETPSGPNLSSILDDQFGIGPGRMPKSAEESAQVMFGGRFHDPQATGNPELFDALSGEGGKSAADSAAVMQKAFLGQQVREAAADFNPIPPSGTPSPMLFGNVARDKVSTGGEPVVLGQSPSTPQPIIIPGLIDTSPKTLSTVEPVPSNKPIELVEQISNKKGEAPRGIKGIALTDEQGALLAQGGIGQIHADIKKEALETLLKKNPDADPFLITHGFVAEDGSVLSREEAWKEAKATQQIDPVVQQRKEKLFAETGKVPQLEAQDFKKPVPESVLEQQKAKAGKGKMMKVPEYRRTEGGGALPDVLTHLGTGALVGGAAGALFGSDTDSNGFAIGAGLGMAAAIGGPAIVKALAEAKAKTPTTRAGVAAATAKPWSWSDSVSRAKLAVKDGTDTMLDRATARMDTWFATTRSESLKRVMAQSRGPAEVFVRDMENAFRSMSSGFQPDDVLKKDVGMFLEGDITEATLLQSVQNATADKQAYVNFALKARDSIDGLIELAAPAAGNAKRTQMMLDSRREYMRQSYKLFTKDYKPTPEVVDNLVKKLDAQGAWPNLTSDGKRAALIQYADDVQRAKGLYKPFQTTSSSTGSIDQTIFRKRKVLDKEWKDFLGEVTDPVERVHLTTLKLRPVAEAAQFMSKVMDKMTDAQGIPLVFSDRTALESFAKSSPQSMTELGNYRYVDTKYSNGQLQGKLVSRHVADVLEEWDNHMQFDSAHTRAMNGINRFMKANVTYRNPAAIARQFLGTPFFAMIAKANPEHLGESLSMMKDNSKELLQNGILGVDSVSRDVWRELDTLSGGVSNISSNGAGKALLGNIDSYISKTQGTLRNLDGKAAELFRFPDNLVRVNTYLSAKHRIAEELGKAMDDPEVINKAVEFTNRYTMNYDLISPAVAAGRKVPGLNLFLTFTSEMTRLLKNVGDDAIRGDAAARTQALLSLGALTVIPETLQQVSEGQLSEKDRADWEKVKAGLPHYSKHRYKVVTGRDPNGNFNFIDFSSIVPTDNFAQMGKALMDGNLVDAAKLNPVIGWDNSPIFNIFAQQISGEDRFTKRQLRGIGDRVAITAREIGGPLTPGSMGGSIWRHAEQAFATNAKGEVGITDKSGRRLTPADFFAQLGGLGSGQYSLTQIQKAQIAEAKSDVANELAYLNDIVKSDLPLDRKQKAAEKTKEVIVGIQATLQQTLGINPDHSSEATSASSS